MQSKGSMMRWTDIQLVIARQEHEHRRELVEMYLLQKSRLGFTAKKVLQMSAIDLHTSSDVAQNCNVSRQRVSAILKEFSKTLRGIQK